MNPTEYERALAEKLLYEFPPPFFRVVHDLKVKGVHSGGNRQIDVAVFRAEEKDPFLAAEAKLHSDTLNIGYIDAFVTKVKEVNAKIGIMVVSSNYSAPGRRLARAFDIGLRIMTVEEALEMQWRPIARKIFPMDWAFHPQIAAALYRLQKGDSPESIIEAMEGILFDEWLALVEYALQYHTSEATGFLWFVALHHYDDGWRFNAIQELIMSGAFDQFDLNLILERERDPAIVQMLIEYGYIERR
jgi:hypothetical protein